MRIGVALVLLAACGRGHDELADLDPAEASVRVRAMVDSCDGFSRALAHLSASRISGRPLSGLVDDAVFAAAPGRCADPLTAAGGDGLAERLARARLLDSRPAEALVALAGDDPAIHYRRAELLDRQGRTDDALAELDTAIARAPDAAGRATRQLVAVSAAVRSGRHAEAARAIAAAPASDRPSLSFRAASDAPVGDLDALGAAATEAELASAVGDRLETVRGPAAALAARQRAAAAEPTRAEHHDALARALVAAGRIDEAISAWDRAATAAPAQPAYKLAPIRALVGAGRLAPARARVVAIVEAARGASDPDVYLAASSAAAAIADHGLAVALAREALERRRGDGRLAFAVAERLEQAGDRAAAAAAYVTLLVCGAHARPWHRHEVAGRLVGLATDRATAQVVSAALDSWPRQTCPSAASDDLVPYLEAARKRLSSL